MYKKILFLVGVLFMASCAEDDVPEQQVTFNGHIYAYDINDTNPSSDWNALVDHTVTLYSNKIDSGCSIFIEQEAKGSTVSNDEGFYELSVPLSASGISYTNYTYFWGCPELRVETSDQTERIFSTILPSEKFIESKDIYLGRSADISIVTSDEKLDSAYLTIDNSNELFFSFTLYFFKNEYLKFGTSLGESLELILPYDPNPTYQIELQKYKDGQLTEEIFDIDLNHSQTTYLDIE